MKTLRKITLLLTMTWSAFALAIAAEEPPPKAPLAPPLSPRFKQVRDRVDTLFQHRNETPAPPDPRLNPFRPPGAAPVEIPVATLPTPRDAGGVEVPATPAPKPVNNDVTLLEQSATTLKISGTFEKDGKSYLVINAKPYKEKDVIQTQVQGEPVYLRIRQITRDSVTLLLNEAETTLKF